MSIQKSLVKTMYASLSILSEIHSGGFSVQSISQKIADADDILGQTLNELSLKRRVFIRSVLNSEYKVVKQSTSNNFFGENLPQVVKELSLKKKLGSRPVIKYYYSRNRLYGIKGYYKQNCFLRRGPPNPDHEPWKQGRKYQRQ